MTVILLSGPIASGKSAIGEKLARTLTSGGRQTEFIDLDEEVLRVHGSLRWESDQDRLGDWLSARRSAAHQANAYTAAGQTVVTAGPFYLPDEIIGLTSHVAANSDVRLFVMQTPLAHRLERYRRRSHSSPDEEIRTQDAAVTALDVLPGKLIANSGRSDVTVKQLVQAIRDGKGRLQSG